MTHAIGEKRRFRRVPFATHVTVRRAADEWRVELLDISLKGALIQGTPAAGLPVGTTGTLTVGLAGDARIVMEFTVAHRDGGRVGLRCDAMDLDSVTHLKRLVELNTGRPEEVDRELAHLIDAR